MPIKSKYDFSFIFPVRNRANLLMRGLESLAAMNYDKSKFEVVIADYLSDDDLHSRINKFRGLLNIKYCCIDIRRYANNKIFLKNGKCNPALAQNLAARVSEGNHLVLTSPEILHWKENLNILKGIEDFDNKMIYGRVIEKTETEIFSMFNPFEFLNGVQASSDIEVLCDWEKRLESATLYFIGVIPRRIFMKYGGIDERYMCGIAYEDEDFGNRLKSMPDLKLEFNRDVFGIHLTHDRSYQDPESVNRNKIYMDNKMCGKKWSDALFANQEYDMGDINTLIEYRKTWRF